MVERQKFADDLNRLFNTPAYDTERLKNLLKILVYHMNVEIRIYNFDEYTVDELKGINSAKLRSIRSGNLLEAFEIKKTENRIFELYAIKQACNINKSGFYTYQNFFFYFHFGNADNDTFTKRFLTEILYVKTN